MSTKVSFDEAVNPTGKNRGTVLKFWKAFIGAVDDSGAAVSDDDQAKLSVLEKFTGNVAVQPLTAAIRDLLGGDKVSEDARKAAYEIAAKVVDVKDGADPVWPHQEFVCGTFVAPDKQQGATDDATTGVGAATSAAQDNLKTARDYDLNADKISDALAATLGPEFSKPHASRAACDLAREIADVVLFGNKAHGRLSFTKSGGFERSAAAMLQHLMREFKFLLKLLDSDARYQPVRQEFDALFSFSELKDCGKKELGKPYALLNRALWSAFGEEHVWVKGRFRQLMLCLESFAPEWRRIRELDNDGFIEQDTLRQMEQDAVQRLKVYLQFAWARPSAEKRSFQIVLKENTKASTTINLNRFGDVCTGYFETLGLGTCNVPETRLDSSTTVSSAGKTVSSGSTAAVTNNGPVHQNAKSATSTTPAAGKAQGAGKAKTDAAARAAALSVTDQRVKQYVAPHLADKGSVASKDHCVMATCVKTGEQHKLSQCKVFNQAISSIASKLNAGELNQLRQQTKSLALYKGLYQ